MDAEEHLRSFPISKFILDTSNSIFWFLADAFWMLGGTNLALYLMIPTIFSGIALLYVEKRFHIVMINFAINCWIMMNTFWILSEGQPTGIFSLLSKTCFVLGVISIIVAGIISKSFKDTFSHFRRFRFLR